MTAARTQAGLKTPVGYVRRSFQYCSKRSKSRASLATSEPSVGISRAGATDDKGFSSGRKANMAAQIAEPKRATASTTRTWLKPFRTGQTFIGLYWRNRL